MKEPDSSIPACKRRLVRVMIFDRILRCFLFGYIFYKILAKYNLLGSVVGKTNETIAEIF